jgi:hypothetical protein
MIHKKLSPFAGSQDLHDEFFRRSLQKYPKLLQQFLTAHLPDTLLAEIPLQHLEYVPLDLFPDSGGKLLGDFAVKTKLQGKDMFI